MAARPETYPGKRSDNAPEVQDERRQVRLNGVTPQPDDGIETARVFIDGYNGSLAGVKVSDWAQAIGLTGEDGDGQRIRVRNPLDVVITPARHLYLPVIYNTPAP